MEILYYAQDGAWGVVEDISGKGRHSQSLCGLPSAVEPAVV